MECAECKKQTRERINILETGIMEKSNRLGSLTMRAAIYRSHLRRIANEEECDACRLEKRTLSRRLRRLFRKHDCAAAIARKVLIFYP